MWQESRTSQCSATLQLRVWWIWLFAQRMIEHLSLFLYLWQLTGILGIKFVWSKVIQMIPGEPSDLVTRTDSLCRMIEAHLSADRANSCQGPDESLWLHSVSFSPQLKQSWKPSSFAFTCPESLLLRPVSAILGKLFSRLLPWVFPSPLLCTHCCQSMFRWSLEFPMAKKSLPLAMVTYRPLVPAPRRQKLVVLCEFQASLVCIVSSVRSGLHCETLSQK